MSDHTEDANASRAVRLELPSSVVEPGTILSGQIRLIAWERGLGREGEYPLYLLLRRRTVQSSTRSEAENEIVKSWLIAQRARLPTSGELVLPFTVILPEALQLDHKNYLKVTFEHPLWSDLADYRYLQVRLPEVYKTIERALFQAMPCQGSGLYAAQLSAISAFPRLRFSYVPVGDLTKNLDRLNLHVGFTPKEIVGQIELIRAVHSIGQRLRAVLGQENRYTFPFTFPRALLEAESGVAEVVQIFRDVITAYSGRNW